MSCNGAARPNARKPFLYPPYHGWTSIVSYFDHDSPNFLRDGTIITATGATAEPDSVHVASDFPAYWSPSLRQYLYYDGHNGYDYNLSYQPLYAAASGKVIFAAFEYPQLPDEGYGRMVMISHRGGYVTLYGHLSRILVHVGQHVSRGRRIGISGNTGHSTGPHLHFTLFHNCTPTDPYGWFGSGPDPLSSYKGETAAYMWVHPPLVSNPAPDFPGSNALPPLEGGQYLLVRLPTASRGTAAFTGGLRSLLRDDVNRLRREGVSAKAIPLLGALRIDSPASMTELYALPGAASIAAKYVLEDARGDVLQALARAALVTQHRSVALDRAHKWSGYLMQWQGRTFLVGRGRRGAAVSLRLNEGGGPPAARVIHANARDGAYALDLGPLSLSQLHAVEQTLTDASGHTQVRTVRQAPARATERVRSGAGSSTNTLGMVSVGLLIVLLAIAVAVLTPARDRLRRPRRD